MSDFDRQIGESGWETIAPDGTVLPGAPIDIPPPIVEPARVSRRAWIVALTLAALAIAVVSAAITRRVDETTRSAQAAVLDHHSRVQYAVAQSDKTLFAALLASHPDWRAAAMQLFDRNALIGRSALGFRPDAAESEVIDVRFSPEFTLAEVATEQVYAIAAEVGAMDPVRLRQTSTYRFERRRWLLSAPDSEFWGRSSTTTAAQAGGMLRVPLHAGKREQP